MRLILIEFNGIVFLFILHAGVSLNFEIAKSGSRLVILRKLKGYLSNIRLFMHFRNIALKVQFGDLVRPGPLLRLRFLSRLGFLARLYFLSQLRFLPYLRLLTVLGQLFLIAGAKNQYHQNRTNAKKRFLHDSLSPFIA